MSIAVQAGRRLDETSQGFGSDPSIALTSPDSTPALWFRFDLSLPNCAS